MDCSCSSFQWTCDAHNENSITKPAKWITNTSDILFDLSNWDLNEWLLQTHNDFIDSRFGGWSIGIVYNYITNYDYVLINFLITLLCCTWNLLFITVDFQKSEYSVTHTSTYILKSFYA